MKAKPFLKTLWISILSTFTLILSQTLTESGLENINTIKLTFLEFPIVYFIVNFFIFFFLTLIFILLNDLMPFHKLYKGVIYSVMVSFVWIALKFQPSSFETFRKYVFDSIVFMIPYLIYGIFLGYLATAKTKSFKFEKRHFGYLTISIIWILFHLIYMSIALSMDTKVFNYILWLITTSLVLGVVFGLIYEFSLNGKRNNLFVFSMSVITIFISYYAYQYTLHSNLDLLLFIKISLDITSILLAVQFLEIYLHRFKKKIK